MSSIKRGKGESFDEKALISDIGEEVRILHIEDDQSFADLVSQFLKLERNNFEVITEINPYDGIERLRNEAFDCVVCDFDMPGMNGLDVLKEVREGFPQIPFILFTGKGSEEIASDAISAGVTDYLQKGGGTEQYEVLANRIEQAVARYRAERQVERGFRAIETAHDGISLLNGNGKFLYLNDAYADIVGYERDELLGKHFENLFRDEEIDLAYQEIIPTAKNGEWRGQSTFVRRNGEPVSVEHALSFTSENTMICTIAENDESVRETLSIRERAMDEAPIGITLTDPHQEDNPIIYANDRFLELTGYSREEVMGRNCRFLQGEGTEDEMIEEMRKSIHSGEWVSVELRNYRKNGEMFWNRVTISPLFDDDGNIEYFVGFQEDVTTQKEN